MLMFAAGLQDEDEEDFCCGFKLKRQRQTATETSETSEKLGTTLSGAVGEREEVEVEAELWRRRVMLSLCPGFLRTSKLRQRRLAAVLLHNSATLLFHSFFGSFARVLCFWKAGGRS